MFIINEFTLLSIPTAVGIDSGLNIKKQDIKLLKSY
jgi:hypothetical protein